MSSDVPAGFVPFKLSTGFVEITGPLYGKWDGERLVMGFRVELRHCNPSRMCHGGMLTTFADMFLPLAARFQAKDDIGFGPTINLSCDFPAPAPLGAWVEGRADAITVTRHMIFTHGIATVDGVPVVRANGLFKIRSGSSNKIGEFALENLFDFTTAE